MKTFLLKHWGKTLLVVLLLIIAIAVVPVGHYIRLTYSDGERVGIINKFSHKGALIKTNEGELTMMGVSIPTAGTQGQVSLAGNTFLFSVPDQQVAAKIKEAMDLGKKVSVHYEQQQFHDSWRGETDYYVVDVKIIQ